MICLGGSLSASFLIHYEWHRGSESRTLWHGDLQRGSRQRAPLKLLTDGAQDAKVTYLWPISKNWQHLTSDEVGHQLALKCLITNLVVQADSICPDTRVMPLFQLFIEWPCRCCQIKSRRCPAALWITMLTGSVTFVLAEEHAQRTA